MTGTPGEFVDSHIIPLALTRLSGTGEKRIETGIGLGIKRRTNSWYDGALVTRRGEDILARIDWKAIEELRAHRLVWSGWGSERQLQSDDVISYNDRPSHRLVAFTQPKALQLFFLSLLWRAGASTRHEFAEISLSEDVLEDLRIRVLNEEPGPAGDYPVHLFQIITRGPLHNRTPLLETKPLTNIDGSEGPLISYARFYLDGLVAHIHLPATSPLSDEYLTTCLRYDGGTIVFVHEFESSRTARDIAEMVATVHRENMTVKVPLTPISDALRRAFQRDG